MTTIVYQFAEKNILIKSVGPHQYSFKFNGNEDEFVVALTEVMDAYGYVKQFTDWCMDEPFDDSYDYYIEKANDEEVYIAFNWKTKEVAIS